jgi:hypothetical protein
MSMRQRNPSDLPNVIQDLIHSYIDYISPHRAFFNSYLEKLYHYITFDEEQQEMISICEIPLYKFILSEIREKQPCYGARECNDYLRLVNGFDFAEYHSKILKHKRCRCYSFPWVDCLKQRSCPNCYWVPCVRGAYTLRGCVCGEKKELMDRIIRDQRKRMETTKQSYAIYKEFNHVKHFEMRQQLLD